MEYYITYIKIDKEILPFDNVETEKKLLVSKKVSFNEKTVNTLLVTCSIIIKWRLYKLVLYYEFYKTFFSLLIINKYYITNSITPVLVY